MKSAGAEIEKATEYRGYRLSSTVHRFQYGIEVSGIGVFDGDKELVYAQSAELAKRWVDETMKGKKEARKDEQLHRHA